MGIIYLYFFRTLSTCYYICCLKIYLIFNNFKTTCGFDPARVTQTNDNYHRVLADQTTYRYFTRAWFLCFLKATRHPLVSLKFNLTAYFFRIPCIYGLILNISLLLIITPACLQYQRCSWHTQSPAMRTELTHDG